MFKIKSNLFQSICCDSYIREYEADNTDGSTYVLFCNKLLDQWTGKIKSYQNRKRTQHQPLPIAPAQWTYFSIERHSIHPWMPPSQNFPQTQTLKTVPEQSQMEETTSKPLKMANDLKARALRNPGQQALCWLYQLPAVGWKCQKTGSLRTRTKHRKTREVGHKPKS